MINQIWIYYGKIENLVKEGSKREREQKAGRLLLLSAVNECRMSKIQSLEELERYIETGVHGKPYFRDKSRFPFFNISHSGDYAVCAVAPFEVGIDIQKIQKVSLRLLKRVLTKGEVLQVEQSERKEASFCKIWTQKESYVKWSGQGLTRELCMLERDAWQNCFLLEDYYICVTAQRECETVLLKREKFLY